MVPLVECAIADKLTPVDTGRCTWLVSRVAADETLFEFWLSSFVGVDVAATFRMCLSAAASTAEKVVIDRGVFCLARWVEIEFEFEANEGASKLKEC